MTAFTPPIQEACAEIERELAEWQKPRQNQRQRRWETTRKLLHAIRESKGISRMRKRELVEAVERVDPQFRQPRLDLVCGVQRMPNSSFPRTGRGFGKKTG